MYTELKFYVLLCMGVKLGLTLIEEHRFRMFENRVLRRISGPDREDVMTGGWQKLHKELHHS
jgi:hypothetical protein